MYKDLEFVCGGNLGRSPIEAAVATMRLERKGYSDVKVSSSGTAVDFMKTATPEQVQRAIMHYLPTMIEAGVITSEQERDLKEGKNVKEIVAPILHSISVDEQERVLEILCAKGLSRYVDTNRIMHPKQTIARPYAELILVNGEKNLKRVNEIYAPTSYRPLIENLGEFPDPMFASFQEHKRLARKLRDATIEAIERFYN